VDSESNIIATSYPIASLMHWLKSKSGTMSVG